MARSPAAAATLLLALTCSGVFAADMVALRHVPHFDKVDDHVYRGGRPELAGFDELKSLGIKRVIDLRPLGRAELVERQKLVQLGIQYVNVPFAKLSAPSPDQMETVLKLLSDSGPSPIFVHCWRGKDRTGTVVACYRIRHDNWSARQALEEARAHGMSSLERGMQQFILHFQATPALIH